MYNRQNNKVSGDEASPRASKTEASVLSSAPVSDSYGSTSAKDKTISGFYVPFCGVVFYIMAFFGFFCAALLRQGLSVAIVAMVNHSTVSETIHNISDEDRCPKQPEVKEGAGEFNWDPTQEEIVLAAFYYGYGVTQVSFTIST